jgi:hypothetical protein
MPPDTVLDDLFVQACLTRAPGEPYIEGLRRYTELLLVELQGQVFDAAHTRAYDAERRERKRARPPDSSHIPHIV